MTVLVKMNKQTLNIYLEENVDMDLWEFAKDEKIYYTGTDIVLFSKDYKDKNFSRYKRELTKAMISSIVKRLETTNHELNLAYKKLLDLNEQYLKLVKDLI